MEAEAVVDISSGLFLGIIIGFASGVVLAFGMFMLAGSVV